MNFARSLQVVNTHTAGEPTCIVTGGLGKIPRSLENMSKVKEYVRGHFDHLRKLLVNEPRGHRDMFGAILVPAISEAADVGVIFFDTGDFLDMCVHGSIGVASAVVSLGIAGFDEQKSALQNGDVECCLDTPAGLVTCLVQKREGRVVSVRVRNVASAFIDTFSVSFEGRSIPVHISYGGNYFAIVRAEDCGLRLCASSTELVSVGLKIRDAVNALPELQLRHPTTGDEMNVALTELIESGQEARNHGVDRNCVVFGAGQIDRSPCGTGTSAKMALLFHQGKLRQGEAYRYQSVLGTEFVGRIVEAREEKWDFAKGATITPEVEGSAYITSMATVFLQDIDPFPEGFSV